MSDNQAGTDGGQPKSKAPAQNGAFLAIGFVFFILGITQMTGDNNGSGITFFCVGITFMILGWTSGRRGDKGATTASDAPVTGGTGGPADGDTGRPDGI